MKHGFEIEWERINPALAYKYLETMGASNRNVRQSHIDYLASQMKAGMWRRNPQPIIFDKQTRMVDGQHRMWAIIESNTTQEFAVARGLNPEDVAVIDSGLGRDYSDVAHYQGWNSDPLTSTIAKILVRGPGMASGKVPPQVVHEWYLFYQEQIDFSIAERNRSRAGRGKAISAPMTAAIARAFPIVGAETLDRFCGILKEGVVQFDADRAALTLRDAWLQGRLGNYTEAYLKTEAAIRAFHQRRATKHLQKPADELFKIKPLPQNLRFESMHSAQSPRSGKEARARFTEKVKA